MTDPSDERGDERDAPSAKEIFSEAIEKPRDVRQAWLAGACRGRPRLREQVETLLEAWDRADEFMASPTLEREPPPSGAGQGPGSTIGVYKLLQTIGEGGMGIVYMAEQERPVRRKVALKIIKLGMDTKQVIGRFEAERQALAMMDHPNIARVLDAGSTETGRPYFVMELVKGVSINEYCDKTNLTTRQRLELFVLVCHAIQHAHQKGIIHRDLKPSNVLVTLHDGVPVPKVIDFGIAKATHQRLTERTVFTEFRSFIGTPEYMSPEQAELSGLDIDTRSDIYSLGVLLYELLVGTTPFDGQTLRSAAFDEMQRIIREQEPPKPSTRLSIMGETATAVARHRSLDAAALARALRGDLDWIVMKALEKDRTRRYESASELAADIGRHLHDEPVLACPPSLTYKARKFVHRNKSAVIAAGVILVLLVGGILGTTWGMIAASRQQALALDRLEIARSSMEAARLASQQEEEQRKLAEQARIEAERQRGEAESQAALAGIESERARAVTSFLVDTLAQADPGVALTPDITVRQMLDRAADAVGAAFAGQPLSEATLRATIGQAYYSLGELELAEPHLRRAVGLWDRYGEPDRWELYTSLWHLVSTAFANGSREVQTTGQRVVLLGIQLLGQDQVELASALSRLVDGYMSNDLVRGKRAFEEVQHIAEASLEPGDRRWRIVADDLFASGYASWYFVNNPGAADLLDAAMRIYRRELPETHPQVLLTIEMLVKILNANGEFERGEALVRESIEIRKRMLPPGHSFLANAEALLGQCLVGQARYAEAERILLASLADLRRAGGGEEVVRGALVDLYEGWDRPDEAREQREALARSLFAGPAAPDLRSLRLAFGPELGELLAALERLQSFGRAIQSSSPSTVNLERELVQTVDRLLPLRRELVPDDAPLAPLIARELINWVGVWERSTPTIEMLRAALIDEARSIFTSWEEELPGDLGWATYMLGDQKTREDDSERAELLMREGLQLVVRGYGRDAWTTATVTLGIADLLAEQSRLAEAEPLAVEAHAIFVEQVGERSWDTFRAARTISVVYQRLGRSEDARSTVAMQVDALRRVAEDLPINRNQLHDYADFLLTCVPADLRDPATALVLAEVGYGYGGQYRAPDLATYARALFETGDARGAVARQEEALRRLDPNDAGRPAWEEQLAGYRAAAGD